MLTAARDEECQCQRIAIAILGPVDVRVAVVGGLVALQVLQVLRYVFRFSYKFSESMTHDANAGVVVRKMRI